MFQKMFFYFKDNCSPFSVPFAFNERSLGGRTFSALGAPGEPEGALLPWVSVPESLLSGGFRVALGLPRVGQPVSLAMA